MYLMETPEGIALHCNTRAVVNAGYIELDLSDPLHRHVAALFVCEGRATPGAQQETVAVLDSLGEQLPESLAEAERDCHSNGVHGPCDADLAIRSRTVLDQADEWGLRMAGMARVVECRTGS